MLSRTETSLQFAALPLSPRLVQELRSDHAGEVGAVAIYEGILAVSRNAEVIAFAGEHLQTEQVHRQFFNDFLPPRQQSRLLPLWRLSGWLLGALPALFGPVAVFTTIDAVETFVDGHYAQQLEMMKDIPALAPLGAQLATFRDDEVHHQQDAAQRHAGQGGFMAWLWHKFVAAGSVAGVAIARHI